MTKNPSTIRTASILGATLLLAVVGGAAACSSTSASGNAPAPTGARRAAPTLRVVNGSHTQISAGTVIGIVGSYEGCAGQSDATSWVLDTPGNGGAMELLTGLSAPSVALDDSACALQIDSINTSATGYPSTNEPTALVFTGPSVSANTYFESAVGFDDPTQGNALSFYANAESTVVDSSGNFAVTILLSDDPNIVGPTTATATLQPLDDGGITSVGDIPTPDYTTDFSNLTLQNNGGYGIVTGVSGTVDLDFQSQGGEAYLIFKGQDLSTSPFAAIDAYFNDDVLPQSGIPGGNGTVSVLATSLVSGGDQLPETSTVVVQHIDGATDIATYEILAITFNAETD